MLALNERFEFKGQSVAWGAVGDGDPLVLIHGFPWSSQCWRRLVPWLAGRKRVYYFDMLGCGQSEKFDGQAVSESVQSELLAALIGHWGIGAPQIVGHDFGGLAALRGHFLHGLEYAKLHLINAVALLPSGSPFYAHVARHETAFAGLPDYAHEALFRAYIQAAAHVPLRGEVSDLYLAPWSGDVGRPAFYRHIAQADTANIDQVQARYGHPDFEVHVAWGIKDSFIPVERGRKLADILGAESFTPIEGAAHLVHEDAPEALLGQLLSRV